MQRLLQFIITIDNSRPDRDCERCGKSYRGPAIYCSMACAQADA